MIHIEPAPGWVVITSADLYLVWPADVEPPSGWQRTGFGGTMAACVSKVDDLWRRTRPVPADLRTTRDRMVAAVVRELAPADGARETVVRLVTEMLSRCLDALQPGTGLSEGPDSLRPRESEPPEVRTTVLKRAASLIWQQLAAVIGPYRTPPREVCAAAEALFDCLVELAR